MKGISLMNLNAFYNPGPLLGKLSCRLYQSRTLAANLVSYPCDNTGACLLEWAVQKILLGGVDTLVKRTIITPC
jgi:hypothetical protein